MEEHHIPQAVQIRNAHVHNLKNIDVDIPLHQENDAWYQATSELEPDAMVAELRTQGMAGIYLDLDGYTEDEQQPTLAALIQAAGCAEDDVIISESGKLCYIPLGQE